jgi:D-arginine dehydrogenase
VAEFDIAIIGAGIAGASLAAECARHTRVLLLEAEETPGYHTTGRSAAFWEECYGGPEIVPLTLASGPYLREHGFLSPRGALYIARGDGGPALDAFVEKFGGTGATIERIGRAAMLEKVPGLREAWTDAVWEPLCSDIDVAGLHQHYLTLAKRHGVELHCRARVARADRSEGEWRIASEDGRSWTATTLVNAAGAWADELARIAGARLLGIQPLRRTICQLATEPQPLADQPLVLDIGGQFYFKPEAGRVWLSPHDEEPSPPCDAAPEELAVAEAIDRFEQVVDWQIERVERKWAGLRSFAPDRLPVYGADPRCDGFFWFAGQGGYGIQTAPAAAKLAAQLLLGLDPDDFTSGLDTSLYSPARFG